MKRIITALIIFAISVTITPITSHAETYAEKWLREQNAINEEYMNQLEADGNLTQEAIDSITQGTSKRKPNSKKTTAKNNTSNSGSYSNSTYSYSDMNKGWVYGVDELHVTGLPTDERGYTKAGVYGIIPKE